MVPRTLSTARESQRTEALCRVLPRPPDVVVHTTVGVRPLLAVVVGPYHVVIRVFRTCPLPRPEVLILVTETAPPTHDVVKAADTEVPLLELGAIQAHGLKT